MRASIFLSLFLFCVCAFSQESDSIITERIQAIQSQVPLEFNPSTRGAIYQYSKPSSVKNRKALKSFLQYDEELKAVFIENEVPIELRYACISLSNCSLDKDEEDGRQGFFNMTYAVAKKHDLVLTNYIDERRDVLKSAKAFCLELSDLYLKTGDWRIALTQYAASEEEWLKARTLSNDSSYDFWKITSFLSYETKSVYPRYVAAVYLANYYQDLGYDVQPIQLETEKVLVEQYTTLYQLASKLGIDFTLMKELNPIYKKNIIPQTNEDFYVNIPAGRVSKFYDLGSEVYQYAEVPKYTRTEVKVVERVIRDTIEVDGFPVVIPQDESDGEDYTELIYAVRSGDILLKIADLYDCEVVQIQRWNNLDGESIDINQKLKIKVPTASLSFYKKIDKMTTEQRRAVIKKD